MPAPAQGVDPLRVDTTAQYASGYEIGDPRGGTFAGNTIKYVQANGAITAADAVKIDFAATAANRRFTVIRTAAVSDRLEGIANVTLASGQFGWITVNGFFPNASNLNAGVAGSTLAPSATAGALTISPSAAVADAIVVAGGRRAFALVTPTTNVGDILIGG